MEVVRFDGQLGGDVSLVATWGISRDDGKELILGGKSDLREATGGSSYDDLVSAHSRLVEAFSREIADAILSVAKN